MAEEDSAAAGSPLRFRRRVVRVCKRRRTSLAGRDATDERQGGGNAGRASGDRRCVRQRRRRGRRDAVSMSTRRHRTWRCVASRGKKVCANRRNRACATRNRTPLRKVFLGTVQAMRADDDARPAPIVSSAWKTVRATPTKKKSAFYRCFFSGACPPAASPTSAAATTPPSAMRDDAMPPGRPWKKSCAKVLTPRKTVIRFRPKQHLLRKRVSRINTTARETTQPIVRTRIAVDAGLASPGKTQRPLFIAPASPGDAGVFVFVGARVSHARTPEESASPRVSRRRLPTGPTPAAFLAAGPASGQMCCNQT